MLEDTRQPAFGFDLDRLAMLVQALDLNRRMPFHLAQQTGNGETAFHTHRLLFGGFDDLRI